ncbi:unnamed protein product, partial [Effrenium voratum]
DAITQPGSSTRTMTDFDVPETPMSEMQDLEPLVLLCQQGRTAEALSSFERLLAQAREEDNREVLSHLRGPIFAELRAISERRNGYMKRLCEPAFKEDSEWRHLEVTDPEIDPKFKITMRLRFARGAERNAANGGSQILIASRAEGFPVSLLKFAAFHSRTEHLQK